MRTACFAFLNETIEPATVSSECSLWLTKTMLSNDLFQPYGAEIALSPRKLIISFLGPFRLYNSLYTFKLLKHDLNCALDLMPV